MPNPILTRAIDALASRTDLSEDRTAEVLAEIMHGDVSQTQIAGFLIALRTKGETVDELAGLARTMRALAAHVPSTRKNLLDTAGTGGGRSSFNVSTTAALIAAGAGCAVAKHGNRSATSRSGSADLLEALGARIASAPRRWPLVSTRPDSGSCSHPRIIRPRASWYRYVMSSRCVRSSTCSGR